MGMDNEILNKPLEDKELAMQIRKMAANHINFLLRTSDQKLLQDEKKLKYDIIRSLAPNLFPKLKQDEEILEEEIKLSDEEQAHLNKILDD